VGGDIDGDAKPDIVFTSFDGLSQFTLSIIRNANCYKPIVEPTGPLTICAGGTIDLSARKGIGITYAWDKDNVVFKTGPEDTIIVKQPGVYRVTATSESGSCTEISNAVIVNPGAGGVPTDPVIYNTGPFCQDDDIILSTDNVAGGLFLWLGPDNFSSTDQNITIPGASAINAGLYQLQVTVGECSSNVSTTTVDVITLPPFSISTNGSAKICEGNSVQLSVNQIIGYTYQWYLAGLPIVGAVNSTYDAYENGPHHVEITQNSTVCTTESDNTININVVAPPVADFFYTDPACANNVIQFINSSTFETGESVGYSWDFGDGSFIVNNENPTHTYTTSGPYTITFIVSYTDATCRDTLLSPITINPSPVFEVIKTPDQTICEGNPVDLTTSAVFPNYLWSTGETTPQITVYSPDDYSVTVTDPNGCTSMQTETIDMWPKPLMAAIAEPEQTVEDSEVQLDASGALSFMWSPADLLDNPLIANPIATVSETTEFIVIGENANQETCFLQMEMELMITGRLTILKITLVQ
jgi:PKD repeat protein